MLLFSTTQSYAQSDVDQAQTGEDKQQQDKNNLTEQPNEQPQHDVQPSLPEVPSDFDTPNDQNQPPKDDADQPQKPEKPTNPDDNNEAPDGKHKPDDGKKPDDNKPDDGKKPDEGKDKDKPNKNDGNQPSQPDDKPKQPDNPGQTDGGTTKPNEPSTQNQTPYYPGSNDNGQHTTDQEGQTTWQAQVPQQYHHLFKDAFKYNPFIMQQFQNIRQEDLDEQNINAILKPERFENYAFLSALQENTNYFKFQSFSPLDSESYYKNLDKQVLGLVASEMGTMPDLKKTARKAVYKDDIVKKKQIKQVPDKKVEHENVQPAVSNIFITMLTAIAMFIFLWVVFLYLRSQAYDKK